MSALAQVFEAAGVGLHSWEPPQFCREPIIDIARGLIAMRKAGLLRAVYIDAGVIRIAFGKTQLRSITHDQAARVIRAFREGEL